MDIPNLNQPTIVNPITSTPLSKPTLFIVIILALSLGFWGSRLLPSSNNSLTPSSNLLVTNPENITDQSQIETGKLYGNVSKTFSDTATGVIEKGSINGEGTHILNREGGATQRASLTSSVVDLDLFVGKKVQVTGQTNSSIKTSWLLDVGTIKILQ
ncbi:MAG: hypothetical protein WC069_02480 [Candidatus Shapirobacteria bacterium]